MSAPLIGIDLGGTKIEIVLLSPTPPYAVIKRERIPTENAKGVSHIHGQIKKLFDHLTADLAETPSRIGLGHPGVVDSVTGLLKNSNTLCLNHTPLKRDLEALLQLEIAAANDANCFALAESLLGAGRGARTVFGVIMGTGCGGGIVIDGKVLHGAQGIAGEWGHNVLFDDGPMSYDGRCGVVEEYLCGPSVERFYRELTGEDRPLSEILSRIEHDSAAALTIERLTKLFGRAIATIINILDPEVIVLGGGVSNVPQLLTQGVEAAKFWVFNNRLETKLVRNELGDSAGVFGAALLAGKEQIGFL